MSSLSSLVEVPKSELTNKINNWVYSPRHLVQYQGKQYVLLGRKLSTLDCGAVGEVVLCRADLLEKTYTFPLPKEVTDQTVVAKEKDVVSLSKSFNA